MEYVCLCGVITCHYSVFLTCRIQNVQKNGEKKLEHSKYLNSFDQNCFQQFQCKICCLLLNVPGWKNMIAAERQGKKSRRQKPNT